MPRFINNACPLIEEILAKKDVGRPVKKQQKQNEMIEFNTPEILAAFTSKLLDVFLDLDENNTLFSLYSIICEGKPYSLIIESSNHSSVRFYFAELSLILLNKFDVFLLAGSRDGALLLWDLRIPDTFYKSEQNTSMLSSILHKFPSEIRLRPPSYSSLQELLINPSSFVHKAAISKIWVSPENSVQKELMTLDILNQLIVWKVVELNSSESERNWINFGSKSRVKLVQSLQINLSDTFDESIKEQYRILNLNNFEIDIKENLLYFCSNSKLVKSDKYGSISSSPPNIYTLKENFQEAAEAVPFSVFITNTELFYVGYSDGVIGYVLHFY